MFCVSPMRVWYAVVREMTSHGLAGQLGVAAGAVAPISTTLAEAAAGSTSMRQQGREKCPGHARIQHERAAEVVVGARPARPCTPQIFWTLTALGPFSPFSSS